MKSYCLLTVLSIFFLTLTSRAQTIEKKSIAAKKIAGAVKIDGDLNDIWWKDATVADHFTQLEPTPFFAESKENESLIYLLYNNEGVYIGGYLHEKNKDSIATELNGRDGFGNNDFIGVIFDTYQDKLNGFEYFLTPLNEQMDAKTSAGGEDFSWNAVWQSAVKMQPDGWSFEMFIPYSAIRFGKKKIQDWGINIVRQRRKSGQKFTWQTIDPNVNGFLTQEGNITGFENIVPPLRLQLSPYFSTYYTHDDNAEPGTKKSDVLVNGGMDVKYGINQAFTIDMTLIPDFGQVQTDNLTLNLSPFEQQFSENRAFFTEGTELFSKGDLFYSRRIGGQPLHFYDANGQLNADESIIKNPAQSKLINATKLSGRTQKGLGVGILNAVTKPQYAVIENATGEKRKFETDPLTNYNVFVLDQTLKNNSSISFVNTSVLRSGTDYDADVAAALFDFNNKANTRNVGGNISISNVAGSTKTVTGYSHRIYFGKNSGRFNYRINQNLIDDKFDKSDLGYFTNNNFLSHNLNASYNWNTPKNWYNRININAGIFHSRLVKPIDIFKGRANMFQTVDFFGGGYAQTKKLRFINARIHIGSDFNDFYEARSPGRVFRNKGSRGINLYYQTNEAKKLIGSAGFFAGTGGVFKRTSFGPSLGGKIRFSSKFSVEENLSVTNDKNAVGWASRIRDSLGNILNDTILFSRRNLRGVENEFNLKYNFNNVMGLSLRARHSWTKVEPLQFYRLDENGDLQTPYRPFDKNVNQNFNFLSVDMIYNWQFNRGSFITLAWKDIGQDFSRTFQKNYTSNLGNTIAGNQFTSFSLRVIYFLDYVTFRNKLKGKKV